MHRLTLRVVPGSLAVCRLAPDAPLPPWLVEAGGRGFTSVTRTEHELSIVGPDDAVPPGVRAERGWTRLALDGPFDFALCGILLAVLRPLAEAGVGIFALSTFDTDHVLVRTGDLGRAVAALRAAGHEVVD